MEQTLQGYFGEWREDIKEADKMQGDTLTELDKISKELLEYEASLHQKITETKENVRRLLKSS